MDKQSITHPPLWGILHIPSNTLLRQFPKGFGHTQLPVKGNPDHWYAGSISIRYRPNYPQEEIVFAPRLFTSEEQAKYALREWLKGPVRMVDWEDGMFTSEPKTPRIKEDMKVVPIIMYMEVNYEN